MTVLLRFLVAAVLLMPVLGSNGLGAARKKSRFSKEETAVLKQAQTLSRAFAIVAKSIRPTVVHINDISTTLKAKQPKVRSITKQYDHKFAK